MNRHTLIRHVAALLSAGLLFPAAAWAQSPHEGIYFGTFHGSRDEGEFALIVAGNGVGTIAAYDAVDDAGYAQSGVQVAGDGSFRFVTMHGVRVEGTTYDSGVSGSYSSAESEGYFTGWRAADQGPLREAAGYYSGSANISGSGPGVDILFQARMTAIIAADGNAFFLIGDAFPWIPGSGQNDELIDLGFDDGFGVDLGSAFPFGPGHGSPFDVGPGLDLPLPFGPGSDVPAHAGDQLRGLFPFGHGPGSQFPCAAGFPFGSGLSTSFHLGGGLGIESTFHFATRPCRPFGQGPGFGWPFNLGLEYSFQVSILGLIDLDFDFSLPTCSASFRWNDSATPLENSGGFIPVGADGHVRGSQLDGVVLEGYLDVTTASAAGILEHYHDGTTWSGEWQLLRRYAPGGLHAARHFKTLPDVNRDGRADILWRHGLTGDSAFWLMNGPDLQGELPLDNQLDAPRDILWVLEAVGELNGDHEPDLVWRHMASGDLLVRLSGGASPVHHELDKNWQVVAAADFDADALDEILLWNSDTGANALLEGMAGRPGLVPFASMNDEAWAPAAVADFDGDSRPDILWVDRRTSDLRIWLMHGQARVQEFSPGTALPGQRELAGVGDLDGDGSSDILQRDRDSGVFIVTLEPGRTGSEEVLPGMDMGPAWQLAAVGDLDGDGTDDLVWRNETTGENTAWFLANGPVAEPHSLPPVFDQYWNIQY